MRYGALFGSKEGGDARVGRTGSLLRGDALGCGGSLIQNHNGHKISHVLGVQVRRKIGQVSASGICGARGGRATSYIRIWVCAQKTINQRRLRGVLFLLRSLVLRGQGAAKNDRS